ncbi:MAG: VOC family protein [Acidimicrobiia bacterium]|nr:VOC family protein [Acidimicrobiia bacterium]
MGTRIGNVILYTADLDRSVEFYRDVIGLTLRGRSAGLAFFDGGDVGLVLQSIDDPPRGGAAEVVLEVDDVFTEYRRLDRAGVEFRLEPRPVTSSETHDLVATDFRDPDGHIVSITTWVPRAS